MNRFRVNLSLSSLLLGLILSTQPAFAEDKFFLLNYAPSRPGPGLDAATLMNYVAQKFGPASRKSTLKVGVSHLYYPGLNGIAAELALLTNDLARAQSLAVPILVQVDTENWLPPELLNWFDPALPGYDPAKKSDVEWFGWRPDTAIKLSWRNWGTPHRIGPPPNLLSPRFQAYEKNIYDQFLPVVVKWYQLLPAEQKYLLVGWRCGWESTINNNYRFYTNGNSVYGTSTNPPWSDNFQPIGYNAAQTAGIKTNGTLTTADYAKIIGRHLTYLARMTADAGIPRDKIFVHGTDYPTAELNIEALVNRYSNPAVSFYGNPAIPLKSNTPFMQAVHIAKTKHAATGYAYGEFNFFNTNYHVWYAWLQKALHDDPDCRYQSLYNYDSIHGKPTVEQALLDAMALYPGKQTLRTNSP